MLVYLYGLHTYVLMFGVGYSQPRDTRISVHCCMGASLYSLKCADMAEKCPKKVALYFLGEKAKFVQDTLVALQIVLD